MSWRHRDAKKDAREILNAFGTRSNSARPSDARIGREVRDGQRHVAAYAYRDDGTWDWSHLGWHDTDTTDYLIARGARWNDEPHEGAALGS